MGKEIAEIVKDAGASVAIVLTLWAGVILVLIVGPVYGLLVALWRAPAFGRPVTWGHILVAILGAPWAAFVVYSLWWELLR